MPEIESVLRETRQFPPPADFAKAANVPDAPPTTPSSPKPTPTPTPSGAPAPKTKSPG